MSWNLEEFEIWWCFQNCNNLKLLTNFERYACLLCWWFYYMSYPQIKGCHIGPDCDFYKNIIKNVDFSISNNCRIFWTISAVLVLCVVSSFVAMCVALCQTRNPSIQPSLNWQKSKFLGGPDFHYFDLQNILGDTEYWIPCPS